MDHESEVEKLAREIRQKMKPPVVNPVDILIPIIAVVGLVGLVGVAFLVGIVLVILTRN
jgi:hypothetical protein